VIQNASIVCTGEIEGIWAALGVFVRIRDDRVMNTFDNVGKRMSRYWNSTSIEGRRLRDIVVSSHVISRERELVRLCSLIVPAVQNQDDILVFA